MRAVTTGKVVAVWKCKEDGWCMQQSADNNRSVLFTYVKLPRKPIRKIGTTIKKGSVI